MTVPFDFKTTERAMQMDTVLILDTETTGTAAPPKDRIVEAGAVLWSVRFATTIATYSMLVEGPTNPATHINGIPEAALCEGATEASVWDRLGGFVSHADALVAHSCDFDRQFTPAGWDQGKPWICSMNDIDWPVQSGSRSLTAIMLAHGLGVSHAHRAITDCLHIARLLERCHEMGHDVRDMLVRAARPKARFRAKVSYDDREKARVAGFRWDGEKKIWWRKMAVEDAKALPFPVEQLAS